MSTFTQVLGTTSVDASPDKSNARRSDILQGVLIYANVTLPTDIDDYSFPLTRRADGIPAISSCLDPTTLDFDNDRFIARIVEDLSSNSFVHALH